MSSALVVIGLGLAACTIVDPYPYRRPTMSACLDAGGPSPSSALALYDGRRTVLFVTATSELQAAAVADCIRGLEYAAVLRRR